MMRAVSHERNPDLIAAWVTGIGIGLVIHMITWLVGNRVTSMLWEPPIGPTVAFGLAIVAGIVAAVIAGQRLASGVESAT